MEKRDLSDAQGAVAPEEQTLPQDASPETTQASAAAPSEIETEAQENPEAAAEQEMTQAEDEATEQPSETVVVEAPTKASLLAAAVAMLDLDGAQIQREQITRIRQQYANIRRAEVEKEREAWIEAGNEAEAFVAADDPAEQEFNTVVSAVRDKKNAWGAEQEESRQKNLAEKNSIIEQINALAEDTDNVNKTFPLYRDLQDRFNAIGEVPATDETSVWKRFQDARERYSDNLKVNKALRDYDFQKNLETKRMLIDEAIGLDLEQDVITAFRRLQELHDKWRQIGPVAKELREEIWTKFKDASAAINKKYQAYFEERKAKEVQNEEAKTALCEKIEAIDLSKINSFNAWEQTTAEILALQEEWKKLGFASRKANNALFARFRARCDEFFAAKAAYFKTVKEEYAANLAKKLALAEKAEALKDSTDWKKTTDAFVALQKEWKTIGAVPKKHSDAVWKRFLEACDHFFDSKKEATSGQRAAEQANLKAKKEIIEALQNFDAKAEDAIDQLHALQDKWQQTGHVPFRDKDKINDAYRAALNALRRSLNISENRMRMDKFETNISQIEGDENKLLRERDRLARNLESRRIELRTYENNLGFLSSRSKSGESMVSEFRRKIDRLKEDIAQIEDKLRLIDSKLL